MQTRTEFSQLQKYNFDKLIAEALQSFQTGANIYIPFARLIYPLHGFTLCCTSTEFGEKSFLNIEWKLQVVIVSYHTLAEVAEV
jgi:hypothetical protein